MRMLFGMLVMLAIPSSASLAIHHIKASDFGGVRHVRLSDFATPKPVSACPCDCPCGDGGACDCGTSCKCGTCPGLTAYEASRRRAIREQRALYVWVGAATKPTTAPEAIHVSVPLGWQGYTKPILIESYYQSGRLYQGRMPVQNTARPVMRAASRSC